MNKVLLALIVGGFMTIVLYVFYGCHGVGFAFLTGLFFHLKIRTSYKIILLTTSSIFLFLIFDVTQYKYNPFHSRDALIINAFNMFIESPIIGRGPGQIYQTLEAPIHYASHAHNFSFTLLAETGVLGILCFLIVGYGVIQQFRIMPRSSVVLLVSLMAWSLIDEPFQWWSISLLSLLALSRVKVDCI